MRYVRTIKAYGQQQRLVMVFVQLFNAPGRNLEVGHLFIMIGIDAPIPQRVTRIRTNLLLWSRSESGKFPAVVGYVSRILITGVVKELASPGHIISLVVKTLR